MTLHEAKRGLNVNVYLKATQAEKVWFAQLIFSRNSHKKNYIGREKMDLGPNLRGGKKCSSSETSNTACPDNNLLYIYEAGL